MKIGTALLTSFLILIFSLAINAQQLASTLSAPVTFKTSDEGLKRLYDMAELKCLTNIRDFGTYSVLVEGASYPNVWLETQPMGGEMYAKRNIEVAKNNQVIFMDFQKADGKLPGMISMEHQLVGHYGWLQGFCFPKPALNMYYWLNKDEQYLKRLYSCLERFDDYLWRVRDSDGDGCLESWCVYDTGDDFSIRLDGAPLEWPHEFAPNDSLINKYHPELQEPDRGKTCLYLWNQWM